MNDIVLRILLLVQTLMLVCCAVFSSPTQDEPGHLVAGLEHWKTGVFDLYRVNPPLVRLLAAAPVLATHHHTDTSLMHDDPFAHRAGSRPVFRLGADFVDVNGVHTMSLLRLARWMVFPFALIGTVVCYRWADVLYGKFAARIAAALWAFFPMVIGHGCLITPDVPSATMIALACFLFRRWIFAPSWGNATWMGITLGVALLTKFTALILVPLWFLLGLLVCGLRIADRSSGRCLKDASMIAWSVLLSVLVIHVGYVFERSFEPLGEFEFVSQSLGGDDLMRGRSGNVFRGTILHEVPVPIPANYLLGIDVQQRDFDQPRLPNYLCGTHQAEGWLTYYAWVVLLRAPVGFLLLALVSLVSLPWALASRWRTIDGVILLAPAILIFVAASLKTGLNQHGRYILPCLPFICIWLSGFVSNGHCADEADAKRIKTGRRRKLSTAILLTLVTLHCFESLTVFPHCISFFNRFSGGPRQGANYLLGSNVDWGQDLLWLEHWREFHPDLAKDRTYLAFEGQYNPFELLSESIDDWPWTSSDQIVTVDHQASYAISTNVLYEMPVSIINGEGEFAEMDSRPLERLRREEPIGWAGYSIRIFSATQLERAFGLGSVPKRPCP